MDAQRLSFFSSQYPFKEITSKDGKPITPARHVMTGPVRLAFARLDKPRPGKPRKDGSISPGKFAALLIVPAAADVMPLLRVVSETGAAKFGADLMQKKDEYGKPFLHSAIKRQAKLAENYEGFDKTNPNAVYLDCSSNFAVPVVDQSGAPIALPSDAVYSGMWCLARIRVYTYDQETKGMGLGLVAIQKLADDVKFSSGDVTDSFGVIEGHTSAAAPASAPSADLMAMLG